MFYACGQQVPFPQVPFRRCPASSISATASPANIFFPMALPGSSISAIAPPLATAPRPAVSLPLRRPRPATSSRWRSATAPLPAVSLPLRRPRPATNLIRQRSTPVWLAIWRTWTGFANSQLRRAAFRCTYSYICTHPRHCRLEPLLRQTQIFQPICTDCLRHLRISAR